MLAGDDLSSLRRAAVDRCEEIAVTLLGKPHNIRPQEMRWGRHGAIVLRRTGDRRGLWYDFSDARGGDIITLVAEVERCSIGGAIRWLRRRLSLPPSERPQWMPGRARSPETVPDEAERIAAARALWRGALPGRGTAAELYFERRGLPIPDDVWPVVRFLPECRFRGETAPHSAVILPFASIASGEVTAVHKIAVWPNGHPVRRRDRSKLKISSGLVKGAAIMIRPLSATAIDLCLCEGFETGLAIIAGGWRRPLFAMGGASFLAKVEPVSQVRRLVIGADHDENGTGLHAAIECGRRWAVAGTFVEVTWPDDVSSDFADLPQGTRFL
ncbi:DUF7146 domain-containing protein [Sinorhizobium medicae]|uniref:DUF7146 domain-containing protein n=1 Tax=Sinorhizobium medicae TaxID=110321 RepID=UPI000FD6D683|nr:toprim domain-containing protein [Sinorhizobium medicae]RVJ12579.1 hypothetical protein CN181_02945 [Sinorhizobium medicae]